MATLEKRITELESRTNTDSRVLAQLPKDDGTYDSMPDGFQGRVFRVTFVGSPNASKERPHADT